MLRINVSYLDGDLAVPSKGQISYPERDITVSQSCVGYLFTDANSARDTI